MNRKLLKYMKSKEESQYTVLDKIFQSYLDGRLQEILARYEFEETELFPEINKRGNLFQVYFRFYNLRGSIEFDDSSYNYLFHTSEEFNQGLIPKEIEGKYDDFTLEKFFRDFRDLLKNDSRFNQNIY